MLETLREIIYLCTLTHDAIWQRYAHPLSVYLFDIHVCDVICKKSARRRCSIPRLHELDCYFYTILGGKSLLALMMV